MCLPKKSNVMHYKWKYILYISHTYTVTVHGVFDSCDVCTWLIIDIWDVVDQFIILYYTHNKLLLTCTMY